MADRPRTGDCRAACVWSLHRPPAVVLFRWFGWSVVRMLIGRPKVISAQWLANISRPTGMRKVIYYFRRGVIRFLVTQILPVCLQNKSTQRA